MSYFRSAPFRATAALLTALLTLGVAQLPLRAQEAFDGLVVRVYDMTGVDRQRRAEAIDVASRILAEAGVDAEWLDCRRTPGAETTACDAYRRPTDLIVRIVHGSLAPLPESRRALGVSIIDSQARSGALATIFIDQLEPVARRARADSTLLLARTIAHEVGHLLLRTNEHGSSGLMRQTWTDLELARNHAQDWLFAAAERSQLRTLALSRL